MACWLNYTCITRRRDKFFLATEDGEYSSAGPLMLNVALVKSGPPGPPLVAKSGPGGPLLAAKSGSLIPKVALPGPLLAAKSGLRGPVLVTSFSYQKWTWQTSKSC